jgi:hypothetical protein
MRLSGQVASTYAVVEGLFGIMNEVGVGIGESTCAAVWFGKPPRACPTCEVCAAPKLSQIFFLFFWHALALSPFPSQSMKQSVIQYHLMKQ